jgi:hypothetical protein
MEGIVAGGGRRGFMMHAAFFPSHHLLGIREQLGPPARSLLRRGQGLPVGLDDDALEAELNRLTFTGGTEHAPADRPALVRRLAIAREIGYAVDHDETSLGVSSVAVPVSIGDSLIGAIGVTGPSTRLSASLIQAIGPELRRAAVDLHHVDRDQQG